MAEILVCDDDKDIVEAIEIYLAQEGHHILKAYDGEQAIRVLQNNPVDLLIIDVMMPKAGRNPGNIEDPRKKRSSYHNFICKIRGYRQDPRTECRRR